jgi:uncharacterized protein YlxW (UPF0749 family)
MKNPTHMHGALVLVLFSVLLVQCTGSVDDTKNAERDRIIHGLRQELRQIKDENGQMLEYIEDVTSTVNQAQLALDSISIEARIISQRTGVESGETSVSETQRQAILGSVHALGRKVKDNEKMIDRLRVQMQQSRFRIVSLEKLVSNIQLQINQREETIQVLETKVNDLQKQLEDTEGERDAAKEVVADQDAQLHVGYYVVGTLDELSQRNIVKSTGWIFDKTIELLSDFDQSDFRRIETRDALRFDIPAATDDVKIVPHRASASFKVVSVSENSSRLEILDWKTFWAVSKYLAIVLD